MDHRGLQREVDRLGSTGRAEACRQRTRGQRREQPRQLRPRRMARRDAAGLHGLRFHDLRHTVITELAEMGVADHVLEFISGHLSRRMLEHYSHIRIDAKRQALDSA